MSNEQIPFYHVHPGTAFSLLRTNPGITASKLAALTTEMRLILHEAMQDAVEVTKSRSSLRSRRGSIWRQIRQGLRPRGSGSPSTVSVTFMLRPWIAKHETGGPIEPVEARYLALPMPDALRADGTLKRRNSDGWRDYKTFVFTSKRNGKKFVVYRHYTTKRLVFLYYLAERVEMKKRLGLLGGILSMEAVVVNAWNAAVMDVFNSVDLYGVAFEGLQVE